MAAGGENPPGWEPAEVPDYPRWRMERGFRDMKTVDTQIQGKAYILPGRRGHDQAQPPAAAQFQQPAGKGMTLGIMIVAQKNGAAPGQGWNGGKAPGAAFFIDHENGSG